MAKEWHWSALKHLNIFFTQEKKSWNQKDNSTPYELHLHWKQDNLHPYQWWWVWWFYRIDLLHANQGVRMGSEVSWIITSWAVTVKVPAWWFSFIFCLFNSLEIVLFSTFWKPLLKPDCRSSLPWNKRSEKTNQKTEAFYNI